MKRYEVVRPDGKIAVVLHIDEDEEVVKEKSKALDEARSVADSKADITLLAAALNTTEAEAARRAIRYALDQHLSAKAKP